MSSQWPSYEPGGGFQPSYPPPSDDATDGPAPQRSADPQSRSAADAYADPYAAPEPYPGATDGCADPYSQASAAQQSTSWEAPASSSELAPYEPAPRGPYGQPGARPYAPGRASTPYVSSQPYSFGLAPEHPQGSTVFILGLMGFALPILTIPGLIIGAGARRDVRRGQYRSSGLLTAGWVLNILVASLCGLMLALFLLAIVAFTAF